MAFLPPSRLLQENVLPGLPEEMILLLLSLLEEMILLDLPEDRILLVELSKVLGYLTTLKM